MKIEFTPSLKTVNNESILGTGNIATGGVAPVTKTADFTVTSENWYINNKSGST